MDSDELKQIVLDHVDRSASAAIGIAKAIESQAELGYKEFRTAEKVRQAFDELRLPYRSGLAITGVKAVLRGGRPGPTVAIIGELDALPIPEHPHCFAETGAAHACGHHAQI